MGLPIYLRDALKCKNKNPTVSLGYFYIIWWKQDQEMKMLSRATSSPLIMNFGLFIFSYAQIGEICILHALSTKHHFFSLMLWSPKHDSLFNNNWRLGSSGMANVFRSWTFLNGDHRYICGNHSEIHCRTYSYFLRTKFWLSIIYYLCTDV